MNKIEETLRNFTNRKEIAGAAVLVRKEGRIVEDFSYGYGDIEKKVPVDRKTMFRLASMTKPVTAIAVMQLVETGKLGLYDQIKDYIPAFAGQKVCREKVGDLIYTPDPNSPTGQSINEEKLRNIQYVRAGRDITVFDLLNHSSGLGMGPVGDTLIKRVIKPEDNVWERAVKYAELPLDFQPGTASGYSAMAGFEVLAAIVEKVSGEAYDRYLDKHIFEPLGIRDITYRPSMEQRKRMPRLYEYSQGTLTDVSDTDEGWSQMSPIKNTCVSGAAGLIGSMEEYEKLAHMLLQKGTLDGIQILKSETVEMMAGKGISHKSEMIPGVYWGLGMAVVDKPQTVHLSRSRGSFGWSGAFGTHFFVDPVNDLEMVLGINRSNIGGAASVVSFAIEDAVRETFL